MSDSYEEVLSRLTSYLQENLEEAPTSAITAESNLDTDLNLDSIQRFEMVADIEDHYDVSLSLDAFEGVQTLGDVAKLVASTLAEPAS